MQQMKWKQTAQLKSSRGEQVEFLCSNPPDTVCHPVGDLEEKRLMSLWSVGQQPSVPACMDKSRLWSPEEWNKPRNYLADKDGSKGKAGSTDVNLQYLYESFFFCPARWEAGGCLCQWAERSAQHFSPGNLYNYWPDKHESRWRIALPEGVHLKDFRNCSICSW